MMFSRVFGQLSKTQCENTTDLMKNFNRISWCDSAMGAMTVSVSHLIKTKGKGKIFISYSQCKPRALYTWDVNNTQQRNRM